MKGIHIAFAAFGLAAVVAVVSAAAPEPDKKEGERQKPEVSKVEPFKPEEKTTVGAVVVGGSHIDYRAVAGTIIVHPKGWDDAAQASDKEADKEDKEKSAEQKDESNPTAVASMFYVAYFKSGAKRAERPLTFLFNGGPGSSTVWLHMGAFGPKRVLTTSDTHLPPAPYPLVNNDQSLLDVSDLVFVDAPGTGFSRISGKDKKKLFYGVDQDAHAFAEFITQFLSRHGRWNSPKYLFGESYGTTRAAALVNVLQTDRSVDFNGVIMIAQILNFDMSADEPQFNPAVDLPYQLALPTYAASAWYHRKLPGNPKDFQALLKEVEHFAMTDFALALQAGASLNPQRKSAIAAKLHQYTGLPVAYINKANLRINGGVFEKMLQDDSEITTGRLDTRFSGPTIDPLSKEAEYDPQSAAISSAYVAALNDYMRKELKYGEGKAYKPEIDVWRSWDYKHEPPGAPEALAVATNVMPDLAHAMKYNPHLKVMVNAGYFDIATPYFESVYEMRHLTIPAKLQANIQFKFYESGHMIYAHPPSLKALHDNVAAFIRETDNLK